MGTQYADRPPEERVQLLQLPRSEGAPVHRRERASATFDSPRSPPQRRGSPGHQDQERAKTRELWQENDLIFPTAIGTLTDPHSGKRLAPADRDVGLVVRGGQSSPVPQVPFHPIPLRVTRDRVRC